MDRHRPQRPEFASLARKQPWSPWALWPTLITDCDFWEHCGHGVHASVRSTCPNSATFSALQPWSPCHFKIDLPQFSSIAGTAAMESMPISDRLPPIHGFLRATCPNSATFSALQPWSPCRVRIDLPQISTLPALQPWSTCLFQIDSPQSMPL